MTFKQTAKHTYSWGFYKLTLAKGISSLKLTLTLLQRQKIIWKVLTPTPPSAMTRLTPPIPALFTWTELQHSFSLYQQDLDLRQEKSLNHSAYLEIHND